MAILRGVWADLVKEYDSEVQGRIEDRGRRLFGRWKERQKSICVKARKECLDRESCKLFCCSHHIAGCFQREHGFRENNIYPFITFAFTFVHRLIINQSHLIIFLCTFQSSIIMCRQMSPKNKTSVHIYLFFTSLILFRYDVIHTFRLKPSILHLGQFSASRQR